MKKIFTILFLLFLVGCTTETNLGSSRVSKISAIQDTIEIGENIKIIDYTDDNTGENFIIKTDEKDYYSSGGDIMVYFSITNISLEDQDAYIVFSLGKEQHIRSIESFSHNEINEVGTSTIKTDIWDNIEFDTYDVSKTALVRKDTKNREVDKVFKDNFKVGETKYYRTVMIVPLGITENEWFIEVFGKDYGHLDPNLWTLEALFNTDSDPAYTGGGADLNGQNDWSTSGFTVINTDDPFEGDGHITSSGGFADQVINLVSGTVYTGVRKTVNDNNYSAIYIRLGTTGKIYVSFEDNGNIWVFDHTVFTDTGLSYTGATYNQVGIAFEAGSGAWEGLAADHFKITIDDGDTWTGQYGFYAATASLTQFHLVTGTNSEVYFDTIGPDPFVPTPSDSCTYSGSGDWEILYSDNCYITEDVYVFGAMSVINDGAGSFGTIADISATKYNFGTGVKIQCGLPNTCFHGHN